MTNTPSPDELRQTFIYDGATGLLFWNVNRQAIRKGEVAGSVFQIPRTQYFRRMIGIHGRTYKAHRIVWAIITGEWPAGNIDHINGDALDNRFENLRIATQAQNRRNSRHQFDNTSGYKGVDWSEHDNKWRVRIMTNGKRRHVGLYHSIEDARRAYQEAAISDHKEFARYD